MSKIIKKEPFYDSVVLIRMKSKMKEQLKIIAKEDRRTLSDWLRLHFEKIVEKTEKNV